VSDREIDPPAEPPADLRVTEIVVGGERLLVFSHALEAPDLRREFALTAAEDEVARMAIAGLSNAEIAKQRGASVRTVANQIAAVLHKLGVVSRRELAVRHARCALERKPAEGDP
jgi:DNA-binding CsgD family transcriptional regulator